MNKISKITPIIILIILLLFLFLNCLTFIISKSPTYDEPSYISSGFIYLKEADMNWNTEHPPLIKELLALPLLFMKVWNPFDDLNIKKEVGIWLFAEQFFSGNDFHKIVIASRITVVFLSIILGIYLFLWSREIWGDWGGLLSIFLYCFCPNILAHSSIATLDLGTTCFSFIYFYYLYQLLKNQKIIFTLPAGILLGLALLSKFSSILLIAITIVLMILWYFYEFSRERFKTVPYITSKTICNFVKKPLFFLISSFAIIILLSIFIIIINYGLIFHQFSLMPYWNGIKNLSNILKKTEFYFLSKTSYEGWYSFYIITYLIKTPLPTICLLIASIVFIIKKKLISFDTLFPVVPIICFFLFPSITKFSVGYRYILPAIPFIFVLIGIIASDKPLLNKIPIRIALIGLLILYLINFKMNAPDYLSYFNELVGGPKNGYKYLVDSNLDWGQDLPGLKQFMNEKRIDFIYLDYFGSINPELYEINYKPIPEDNLLEGIYAISATYLQGLFVHNKHKYDKFKKITPINTIGNSIFIYKI